MKTKEQWLNLFQGLEIESRAFINGQYVQAQQSNTFTTVNPATGKVIASVARCLQVDANDAVRYAQSSFNEGIWRNASPAKKKSVLLKLAALMEVHAEKLALLETVDSGKPISESVNTDIPGAINTVRWYAEAIDKVYGQIAPTENGVHAAITHEPIGVVAAIVPWNFPLLMTCWKIAPALAAGNSVILKPSEKTPLTGIYLAKLAHEAGVPAGVFQVLPGFGHEVGEALALHEHIDCIAFTGSTRTARHLMVCSGESNMKRVWAEAGGKNANIVFPDYVDLDKAASAAASACFYNQGEVCVAGTRLLVHESIKQAFIEKVVEASKAFVPGNPLDPKTTMGALIDIAHKQQVVKAIGRGEEAGAVPVSGAQCSENHAFLGPVILDNVSNDMFVAREEIFGPVLSVIGFSTEEEAIAIANDSPYGLGAALWTSDLGRAHRVASQLRAGTVWVNNYNEGDMTVPFGGFKQSGNGRDKSLHALEKFSEIKTTWIRLSSN